MRGAAAISEHLDTRTASIEVAELLADAMAGPSDETITLAYSRTDGRRRMPAPSPPAANAPSSQPVRPDRLAERCTIND